MTADTFKLDRLLKAARAFVVPGHRVFTSEGKGLLGVVTQQLQVAQLDLVNLVFNLQGHEESSY